MKFIHITDPHLVKPGETLWGLDPQARLNACLDDVARHHADAAFCVITGDLADRGESAVYDSLRDRLAHFPLQTNLLVGNHDDRANFLKVFGGADAAGHVQSTIRRDGRSFLFLDTLKGPPSSAGLFDAPRRAWLAAQLAQAKGTPVFLFMHHPPFAIGHPLMDLIQLDDGEGFAQLLHGHDVRHIFFGHAHRPMSGQWRGIAFSALPGLSHQLPLIGGSVPTVYSDEPPMYSVVLLEDDRTIVHNDAFMNRKPAKMPPEVERETWF